MKFFLLYIQITKDLYMNNNVYIVDYARTPIGKFGGAYINTTSIELGTKLLKHFITKNEDLINNIDHLSIGCSLQSALGQNIARQIAIKSDLPYTVTAETINTVCGSSLDAINIAARMIKCGNANVVVAGGVENMSMAPYALKNARFGYKMGTNSNSLVDTMLNDGLIDSFSNLHMGITAENVARNYHLTRTELDTYSLNSQEKAQKAILNCFFENEIVPIELRTKNNPSVITTDESPRSNLSLNKLSNLKPAFIKDGIITAGNSSSINDGAALVLLMSEKAVKELNITPIAKWINGELAGCDPNLMGLGPIYSTNKLLNETKIRIEDIDYFEINEAFASQSIAVQRELHIPSDKINIYGGAIALGHPIGASGCRIMVTLLNILKNQNKSLG